MSTTPITAEMLRKRKSNITQFTPKDENERAVYSAVKKLRQDIETALAQYQGGDTIGAFSTCFWKGQTTADDKQIQALVEEYQKRGFYVNLKVSEDKDSTPPKRSIKNLWGIAIPAYIAPMIRFDVFIILPPSAE